jgi:hypothetical protein
METDWSVGGRIRSVASEEERDILLEDWNNKGPVCSFSGMITVPKNILRHIWTGGSRWVTQYSYL